MHRDGAMGSQVMLSSLMSSPGAESLDLPISKSELERFAKSVQGIVNLILYIVVCSST